MTAPPAGTDPNYQPKRRIMMSIAKVSDLILGSTASKVRHKAAIPVLLLKAPPDATGSRP